MKQKLFAIVAMIGMVFLVGCTHPSKTIETNVRWTSNDNILTFTFEGLDQYYGTGFFKLEEETIPVMVNFVMPKMVFYLFDENTYNQWHNDGDMKEAALISFQGKMIQSHTMKIRLKVKENRTGISEYDDLELEITRTNLKTDEYDAARHLCVIWEDESLDITLKRRSNSVFNKRAEGQMTVNDELVNVIFQFEDERKFIVRKEIDEVLLFEGTYTTSEFKQEQHTHILTLKITLSELEAYPVNTKIILYSKNLLNE
ncbi:MAG: hypothetical protein WC225_05390 [Acholeplasmataceae bacterium]|nr:hypothetical protein [Acholeplasmataceae bacterium]